MMTVRCLGCNKRIAAGWQRVMIILSGDGDIKQGVKRLGSWHPTCFLKSKEKPVEVLPIKEVTGVR